MFLLIRFFGWWFWFLCGGSLDDDFVLVDSVLWAKGSLDDDFDFCMGVLWWWFRFCWFGSSMMIFVFVDSVLRWFFLYIWFFRYFFTLYYKIHHFISLDLRYQIPSSRYHFGSIFHALQLFLRFFRMICFWKCVKYVNFGSGYEKSYKIWFFCLQSYRRIF